MVASGTGAAAIAAMKNKIVNAYTFSSPLTDELVNLGIADWLINNTRGQDPELKEFLHAVIYVRPDYLNENTALVKRMIGALVKAPPGSGARRSRRWPRWRARSSPRSMRRYS